MFPATTKLKRLLSGSLGLLKPIKTNEENEMTNEAVLFVNDVHRMARSLEKLIEASQNNGDIPHDYMVMAEGLESIKDGVDLVIRSLTTNN